VERSERFRLFVEVVIDRVERTLSNKLGAPLMKRRKGGARVRKGAGQAFRVHHAMRRKGGEGTKGSVRRKKEKEKEADSTSPGSGGYRGKRRIMLAAARQDCKSSLVRSLQKRHAGF